MQRPSMIAWRAAIAAELARAPRLNDLPRGGLAGPADAGWPGGEAGHRAPPARPQAGPQNAAADPSAGAVPAAGGAAGGGGGHGA